MAQHAFKNRAGKKYGAVVGAGLMAAIIDGASAQSQTLLNWDAPPECPQGTEVMAAVREIAGDSVLATTTLHATGNIRRGRDKFQLNLEIEGEDGTYTRTLEARNCEDLLKAAAVVLGLNLKRASSESAASSEPAGQSETGGDTSTTTSASAAPTETETPPVATTASQSDPLDVPDFSTAPDEPYEPAGFWLGLPQGQGALGALPDATLWWSAAVGKRWEPWMAWLSGRYHSPQLVQSGGASDVGAQVTRYGLELGVARGFRGEIFELAPGLLIGVERLVVRGTGQDLVSASATSDLVLVGAGLTGRWFATDWLALALAVGVDVPLSRPRFEVQRLGEQGQLGAVVGRLGLGVEWNF